MTLSVVLPNFNHARYLSETLGRLLAQSPPPEEIIVVDDASTDDSVDVILQWARTNSRVRLLRNDRNCGPVVGMNRGLDAAGGQWVFFSAADDLVLPGLFGRSLHLLARHPGAALCSSLSRFMDETGKDLGVYPSPVVRQSEGFLSPPQCLRALESHGPWFMGNTTLYRREALRATGSFLPPLRSFCDGFACQALALRHGACFIPEPLASWRKSGAGYAATDNADWQGRLEIRERAADYMRTAYADAFPEAYIRSWERQSRYAAGRAAWRGVRMAQKSYVHDVLPRLGPPRGAWDRLLRAGVRACGAAQGALVRLHLFLRFRGAGGWLRGKLVRARGPGRDRRGSFGA